MLRTFPRQMAERGAGDSATAQSIIRLLASGRSIDMNQLTLNHYFHPHMGGRSSMKVVADIVWQSYPRIRARLPQYHQSGAAGLVSPYRALSPLLIGGHEVFVSEGTGAILTYYNMMDRTTANSPIATYQ